MLIPSANFTLRGHIVTPTGVLPDALLQVADESISAIGDLPRLPDCDFSGMWVLPGFLDIHLHGLQHGVPTSPQGLRLMAEAAPAFGITGLCPTLASVTVAEFVAFLRHVKTQSGPPQGNRAELLGSHLEGPFIALKRKGGMAAQHLHSADLALLETFLEAANGTLRLMTLSPELPGCIELVHRLHAAGCTISAGHTDCSAEALHQMIDAGLSHVCHLYDTFVPGLGQLGVTQPGLADYILTDDRLTFEIIADGIHVPPVLIELARRAGGEGRLVGISDCMQGTGLPDGEYPMADGRLYSVRRGDVCRLTDSGMIVGSGLTLNQAFCNLTNRFGFTPVAAARALSTNPARVIGRPDLGRLIPGARADLTVLDPRTGDVIATWVRGQLAYHRGL